MDFSMLFMPTIHMPDTFVSSGCCKLLSSVKMKRQRGFVNNNKVIGINNKYSQPSIINAFAVFAVASSL
jgi:hypothetical protein